MDGESEGEREPVLIRLDAAGSDIEGVVRLVERLGGRVLHAYPPHALFAELPRGAAAGLVGRAGITGVNTNAIPASRSGGEPEALAAVVEVWNAFLGETRRPERTLRGMAWDTPGLQPPDPPPEEMERLRRRERREGEESDPDPDLEVPDSES